ncbi:MULTISPECIES: hypothetical protein [unclassified Polaribacter]|uniref:hypothetical protein n=1 Tax=unclassified Polaribacter TaxID=196858 RepID=UPI0011BE47B6|nr:MULTISPECIES: hypothetical protein [unclassified Polaribacter]TXD50802.1 hypothetical protein ES043_14650 [Polaribacter sp. IC063]TXD57542.1 hypothetical protein ES044_14825 [Polaribacter sp. IC066]
MNVEKSIEKKRIVYAKRFWDTFWSLLFPVFLSILLLVSSFIVFENTYGKTNKENYWFILMGSFSLFVIILVSIIFYFKLDILTEFKGKSRTSNKKMTHQFLEKQGYKSTHQTNNSIFFDIKVPFFGFSDYRKFTVLFKEKSLFYNCITFANLNRGEVYMFNFKSPFYWFANKKHEKFFREFLKENS